MPRPEPVFAPSTRFPKKSADDDTDYVAFEVLSVPVSLTFANFVNTSALRTHIGAKLNSTIEFARTDGPIVGNAVTNTVTSIRRQQFDRTFAASAIFFFCFIQKNFCSPIRVLALNSVNDSAIGFHQCQKCRFSPIGSSERTSSSRENTPKPSNF